MSLQLELEANFDKFTIRSDGELQKVRTALSSEKRIFVESYTRIASLNAWREQLLSQSITQESLAFFLEAQNDALTSHTFATFGAWRSANQALRACIENSAMCLYFKDHSVELRQWQSGAFRIGYSEVSSYLRKHPDLRGIAQIASLEALDTEYATLCLAVHGSISFRMTSVATNLWSADRKRLGMWNTRERNAISAINQLYTAMFRSQMQSTSLPALRSIIALIVPASRHPEIKQTLGVVLS